MAHPQETRDKVRRAYVFDRLSLEVAAMKCGVSYGTASRWKNQSAESGDNWDKAQSAQLLSGGSIEDIGRQMLAGLVTQYQASMDELTRNDKIAPALKVQLLASLADAFNKTISASKRILPETSELATAMEVVQKLASFIRTHYPQHANAFTEVLEPFGDELAKTYG
ncbi:DUF1804 family protein [Undibacterium sp. FT147W]|uniref:DUF1804 family protein n=1 Tax=Undibacterium rivi TaxID=2828729 RepID=A0ABS5H4L7_9BURK|nr:DUF1804 family protein [Undibacterium rivi]MBR7793792.1 DUF1804 family protein [Undibacterium rivi]